MFHVQVENRSVIPSKIVCVGQNYHEHIKELGNQLPSQMVLFSKPNSAISFKLKAHPTDLIHYEGELCFVVENNSFSAMGFGFDLTKRELQNDLRKQGMPWERSKAFNGSAVFSHFVEINDMPADVSFEIKKNNEIVQMGNFNLMIYKPFEILSEIQSFMDLNDGDIVMTGTPKGVGPFAKSDTFSVTVKSNGNVLIDELWIVE